MPKVLTVLLKMQVNHWFSDIDDRNITVPLKPYGDG